MYCVRISYPFKPGSVFNFEHYYSVHSPLGLEMLMKYGNSRPLRILVDEPDINESVGGHAGYHCICSIYFEDKAGADAMMNMFNLEEPMRLLSADLPNYTDSEPEITVMKVIELDPESGKRISY